MSEPAAMPDPAAPSAAPDPAPAPGGFVAGFPARQDDDASRLRRAHAARDPGFAPRDLIARIEAAFGGNAAPRPKHFSPADRAANPTAGWDPLDPASTAPFADPLAAARAAGYDEGVAAARAELGDGGLRDAALLDRLAAALAGDRIDRPALAERLRKTVLHLVSKLVGETGVSAELLAARVATAAEMLADASESAMLRVNPADVALLEGKLPATIFAVGDAAVARGAFVMESASTIVEDGPALWLDQLAQAIDRLPTPKC